MNNRKRKRHLYRLFKIYRESQYWLSKEDYAWESMRPVGREFGSPDYEHLAKQDALDVADWKDAVERE